MAVAGAGNARHGRANADSKQHGTKIKGVVDPEAPAARCEPMT